MSLLNCDPITGNIITENFATVTYGGKEQSIRSIYLEARKNEKGEVAGADDFDHLLINGIPFPKSYGKVFYDSLWVQFFNHNKELVERIRSYDEFSDGLPEGSVNSAARVFRALKKYGFNGLATSVKPFTKELREKKEQSGAKEQLDDFTYMDNVAKKMVKKYFGSMQRGEIVELSEKMDVPSEKTLKRLVGLRYDEKCGDISEAYCLSELSRLRQEYDAPTGQKGIVLED